MAAGCPLATLVRTMFGRSKLNRVLTIESKLGSGGCGFVYKAWHKRLQKYVVVKEYRNSSRKNREFVCNELEALKNVKCSYLPQVFDFLNTGKRIYIVMEYIEGESFDRLLERGQKFDRAQVLKWYAQLASALDILHRQDICHRDIKPANIMLTPYGDVCLIDFNTALVRDNAARFTSRSFGYASPEQYEIYEMLENRYYAGDDNGGVHTYAHPCYSAETQLLGGGSETELVAGGGPVLKAQSINNGLYARDTVTSPSTGIIDWKRSDIYSLGATMYHLLTGIRPQEQAVTAEGAPEFGRFGAGLAYVIKKSMQTDPSCRFVSATALAAAIGNVPKYDMRKYKAHQNVLLLKNTSVIIKHIIIAAYLNDRKLTRRNINPRRLR